MKRLFNCLIILSLLFTASCSKNNASPDTNVHVLAKLDGQKIIAIADKDVLASFMSEKLYKGSILAKEKSFSLGNFSIESSGSYYYLFGTMTILGTKESTAVAIEIKKLKPRIRTAEASFTAFFVEYGTNYPELGEDETGGVVNTCTGVNCNACAFARNSAGRVIGCNCNSRGASYPDAGSSYCNHTVSGN